MKRLCFFTALLITVAFLSFEKSYAIDPDCLQMLMDNDGYSSENIDSVMVDTCSNSSSFGQWYAKKGIRIKFYNYPFIEEPIPLNTTKYWYDIDTNLPLLREKLQYISNKYGAFTIIRENGSDYFHKIIKDFIMEFENYISLDSLSLDIIDSSANVRSIGLRYEPQQLDVREKNSDTIIYNDGNLLKMNYSLNLNSKIRLIDIYGNIYNTEYTIANEVIDINISYLSTGVYFLLIDNTKPIKFIKY